MVVALANWQEFNLDCAIQVIDLMHQVDEVSSRWLMAKEVSVLVSNHAGQLVY